MRHALFALFALTTLAAVALGQPALPSTPTRAFPVPLGTLVMEQYEASDLAAQLVPFDGGRMVLGTASRALVIGPDLHVERTVSGAASSAFLAVSPDGRFALNASYRFDFAAGTATSHVGRSLYTACDREGRRCVRTGGSGEDFYAYVEDASTGAQLAYFRVLVADAGYTPEEARVRIIRFTHGTNVMLDGDLLALRFTAGRSVLCVFDVSTQTKRGCTALDDDTSLVHLSSASGRACVASPTRFDCLDVRDVTAPRPPSRELAYRAIAADGHAILVQEGETLRVRDTVRFEPLGEGFESDARVAFGTGRYATVRGDRARFWVAGRYAADASLARPLARPERAVLAFVGDALVIASPSQGLARLVPGANGVAFTGPRAGATPQFAEATTELVVWADRTSLQLGRRGMSATSDPALAEVRAESRARFALAEAPHPGEGSDVVFAVRAPEQSGPVFARLTARRLRILDREEHEVMPPIVLPSWVNGAECDDLVFVSANELVLFGQRVTCTPMRVRIAPRRVERLRASIVDASQTSTGARTALLVGDQVSLIDAATDSVVRTMPVRVPGAVMVDLAEDGERFVVLGEGGYELYRPGEPPRAYDVERDGVYDMANDVIYRCDGGNLRILTPGTLAQVRSVPSPSCGRGRNAVAWRELPGFLAHGWGNRLWIMRIADGATLDVTFVHDDDHFVRVLRDGDDVLGIAPDDTGVLVFRDPETGARFRTEPSARSVDARIDAFFRGP